MKWKTGFVLVLVILAVVPLGVESVSGMVSDWEYELWSDVTGLSVSDGGHVAAVVSTPRVSDVYLFDKEGDILWDREFECNLRGLIISQNASHVIVGQNIVGDQDFGVCYFLSKGGELLAEYDIHPYTGSSISFSPNGEYLAIATSGMAYYSSGTTRYFVKDILLNNDIGELLWRCSVNGGLFSEMSVSSKGDVVICAGHTVHFLKDDRIIWEYEIKGYEDFVDVAMSPDDDYIVLSVSGDKGDSIHTLDKSGNLINKKSVDSAPDISSVSSKGTYTVISIESAPKLYSVPTYTGISKDKIKIFAINNTLIEERYFVKPRDSVLSPNAKYAATAERNKIYFYNLSKVTNVCGQDKPLKEIWNNTCDAIHNVTTVEYDQDLIGTANGESFEDHSHSDIDYEAELSYTSSSAFDSVTCISGKNVYVRMGEGDWEKQDYTFQWSMENKVQEFFGFQPPMTADLLRSEVINGEDCWVVKCWPTQPMPDTEATSTVWIAKKNYLPRKTQVKAEIENEAGKASTTRTIYFYDYNEPLDLPKPPTTPCFEVISAIAGLLTVAFILLKRRRA